MKLKNKLFTALGAIVMSFLMMLPVGATENLEVNAIEASKKIQLELGSPAEAEIDVRIYNNLNRKIYSDRISAGATFEREIDFSTFREGTYRLITELENVRYNRVLEVNADGIAFTDSYYSYVPFFIQEDEMMKVQFKNNLDSNIRVTFEDGWGEFFETYYQDPGRSFGAIFNLKELPRGTYFVRLYSGRDTFSYEFEI